MVSVIANNAAKPITTPSISAGCTFSHTVTHWIAW